MTEDEKRKADMLFSLCENSWGSFNERRSYEWKLSLAIWTAISVFITIVLKENLKINDEYSSLIGMIVMFVITGLHGFWLFSMTKVNNLDILIARFYERRLHNLLSVQFPPEIEEEVEKRKKKKGIWSPLAQVSITFLLSFTASLLLFRHNHALDLNECHKQLFDFLSSFICK